MYTVHPGAGQSSMELNSINSREQLALSPIDNDFERHQCCLVYTAPTHSLFSIDLEELVSELKVVAKVPPSVAP